MWKNVALDIATLCVMTTWQHFIYTDDVSLTLYCLVYFLLSVVAVLLFEAEIPQ